MTNRRHPSIRLYMPTDMLAALKAISAHTGKPVQVLIREAVKTHLPLPPVKDAP